MCQTLINHGIFQITSLWKTKMCVTTSYHDLRAVASTVALAEYCLEFPLIDN